MTHLKKKPKHQSRWMKRLVIVSVASGCSVIFFTSSASGLNIKRIFLRYLSSLSGYAQEYVLGVLGDKATEFYTELWQKHGEVITKNLPRKVLKRTVDKVLKGDVGQTTEDRQENAENDNTHPGSRVDKESEIKFTNRDQSRSYTSIYLDKEAKTTSEQAKQALVEQTQEIAASISAINDAAQSKDVTQDVMKELVRLQASQSVILATMRLETFNQREAAYHMNAQLLNISESLDEMNRAGRTPGDLSIVSNSVAAASINAAP